MIDQSLIKVGQVFQSQEEVFQNLSEMIVQAGYATDERAVYEALKLRESEGTTGMMDGFAIPHAKCSAIQRSSVVVLKLDQGVEWQSMDGELIRYVVALFIPEKEARSEEHTSELQSRQYLVCRLLLEKKKHV